MQAILKYPRTRHLVGSALQRGDQSDRLSMASLKDRGCVLVWEEKVDGANSGLSFNPSTSLLVLQSRGHSLDGGFRERQFDLFKAWAQTFEGEFREVLGTRYVLYGEWMAAKHSAYYDALPHLFICYDLYDRETGTFLSTKARRQLLDGLPLVQVHVVHEGWVSDRDVSKLVGPSVYKTAGWRESLFAAAVAAGVDPALALSQTDDTIDAEGVYLKIETETETVGRAKFVRESFVQLILDSGSHWASRPIIENRLAPGVDLFAFPDVLSRAMP